MQVGLTLAAEAGYETGKVIKCDIGSIVGIGEHPIDEIHLCASAFVEQLVLFHQHQVVCVEDEFLPAVDELLLNQVDSAGKCLIGS